MNSLIGNVQFGHDSSLPPQPYDPTRAKQLLAEAGYPNGFKITMACPSGAFANGNEACQAIVGYLQRLGLEVDLQMMEPARYWDLEAKTVGMWRALLMGLAVGFLGFRGPLGVLIWRWVR